METSIRQKLGHPVGLVSSWDVGHVDEWASHRKPRRDFVLNTTTQKDFYDNVADNFYTYYYINNIPFVVYLMKHEKYDIMLNILVKKFNLRNIRISEPDICDILYLMHQSTATTISYSEAELIYIENADLQTLSSIVGDASPLVRLHTMDTNIRKIKFPKNKGVCSNRGILLYTVLTGNYVYSIHSNMYKSPTLEGFYASDIKAKNTYEFSILFTSSQLVTKMDAMCERERKKTSRVTCGGGSIPNIPLFAYVASKM